MRAGLFCAALIAAITAGCSEPCCSYDSRPITLERATQGELLARVTIDGQGSPTDVAVIDTGSPITLWNAPLTDELPVVRRRDIALLGTSTMAPTRATFRGTMTVAAPLTPLPGDPVAISPLALLGGDLLSNFSLEIGFRAPELVIWPEERATDGFLSAAGYAVLHVERQGSGQLESNAPREGIGPAGPYQYPSSLLVLRACGAPAPFDRSQPLPARCCGDDVRTLASGTDLSLLLGTGVGPLVLSRSAWTRLSARFDSQPAMTSASLVVATAKLPIEAQKTTLPRLALMDREADPAVDPGPCVELGRARRLEQVAVSQVSNSDHALCALPCDQDPRTDHRAQNSAGYLELAGDLPVMVIDDGAALLQTLRAAVHPGAPEIDGILGADALRNARVELDYQSQPARAIFSCESAADAASCRAVGRCPRLPERGQTHSCFGLPAHALPGICDNQTVCQ
jgi:hypothetical protein